MREKIEKALNEIRPAIAQHLGGIEFDNFEKGVVWVRLLGTCTHCPLSAITSEAGLEELLIARVPEVERVEAV